MRTAYADPPYLGLAQSTYGHLHPDAADYDRLETHAALIAGMDARFDAWAMSLHAPSLKQILSVCPDDVRICPWVKPFASFKPNVNPGFTWEPVIFRGCRGGRSLTERTIRDYVSAPIALKRGFCGAKPEAFCWWVFDMLGIGPNDEFTDLFPGSGAVTRAWDVYRVGHAGRPLFAGLESP